jgi:hypothetical protein
MKALLKRQDSMKKFLFKSYADISFIVQTFSTPHLSARYCTMQIVITALYHKASECLSLQFASKEKTLTRLSGKHCNIAALWFKVNGIPVSLV